MTITDEMVEAAARSRCRRERRNPDYAVHYEKSASGGPAMMRDPIREEYLGRTAWDGTTTKQWPTMPLWRWLHESGARADLEAAMAAAPKDYRWPTDAPDEMKPGDMNENGHILAVAFDGNVSLITGGRVIVTPKQADAAAKRGWVRTGRGGGDAVEIGR